MHACIGESTYKAVRLTAAKDHSIEELQQSGATIAVV
jgi:hypothetical protein